LDSEKAFELTLHPQVPMPYVQALAPLAALTLCEQLGSGAAVLWPSTVLIDDAEAAQVTAHAGYDEGIVVRLLITLAAPAQDADRTRLEQALRARADAWEQDVRAGRALAGPFAPFASAYFDRLAYVGETIDVLFPNGRVQGTATLKGIDMWGRVCVEYADGHAADYVPEQVSVRRAR